MGAADGGGVMRAGGMLVERLWLAEDNYGRRLIVSGRGPKAALGRKLGLSPKTGRPIYRDLSVGTRQVGWAMGGRWWEIFELIPLAEAKS